jgi:hypothetical protein
MDALKKGLLLEPLDLAHNHQGPLTQKKPLPFADARPAYLSPSLADNANLVLNPQSSAGSKSNFCGYP